MYPSCTLIISIKQLCFFLITLMCLFGNYSPTNILQLSQLTDHHSVSSSWSQPCLWPLPTHARDPLSTLRVVSRCSLIRSVYSYECTSSALHSQTTSLTRAVRIHKMTCLPIVTTKLEHLYVLSYRPNTIYKLNTFFGQKTTQAYIVAIVLYYKLA
jgi:hypothetical protein